MTDQDKPRFAEAMAKLALALRDKEPDAAQMRIYFDSLKDLEIEFVVEAAGQFAKDGEWFPKTSEWRAAAVKVHTHRLETQRAMLRKLAYPLCRACGDTGWERLESDGLVRVRKCGCQQTRWLEVLGRRPWPQLPEHMPTPVPSPMDINAEAKQLASAKGMP